MKTIFKLFFCVVLVCAGFVAAEAQATLEQTEPQRSDKVFEYAETPDYCFYKQKNPMTDFTPEQAVILEQYGMPKFVRHAGVALEKDILDYKRALNAWQEENMYRQEEINTAVGAHK